LFNLVIFLLILSYSAPHFNTIDALIPPKPNNLFITTSISKFNFNVRIYSIYSLEKNIIFFMKIYFFCSQIWII